jgi:hypothetical protein
VEAGVEAALQPEAGVHAHLDAQLQGRALLLTWDV